jgi:hypothetical protein
MNNTLLWKPTSRPTLEEQKQQIATLNRILSYETYDKGIVYAANLIRPSYKTLYTIDLLPGEKLREDMIDGFVANDFKLINVVPMITVSECSAHVYLRIHVEYVGGGGEQE